MDDSAVLPRPRTITDPACRLRRISGKTAREEISRATPDDDRPSTDDLRPPITILPIDGPPEPIPAPAAWPRRPICAHNHAGPVDLTVDGLPSGAMATFSDDPALGNSSILTIAAAETSPGTYSLIVRGSAPNVGIEPASVTLSVTQPRIPIGPRPRPGRGRDLRPGFPDLQASPDLET